MDLQYNPSESRTAELLQYLVEKKLNTANEIYGEYKTWPRDRELTKIIGLTYINNLYNIKNLYNDEVAGLDQGIKGLVLNAMVEMKLNSGEVSSYIKENNEEIEHSL